jgi:arylsulfatase A-like enzyme
MKSGILLFSFFSILSCFGFAAAAQRPNVIVILVDDIGWSGIGCCGAKYPTTSNKRAVRDCQWKLVALASKPRELYDLVADRTELKDLVSTHPDRVAAMAAQYDAWAKRTHVVVKGENKNSPKGRGEVKSKNGKKNATQE